MARKAWTFRLQGRTHTIELEHGTFSGKRVISLDGTVLERSQKFNDTGSRHTFAVDGYEATLAIRTWNGFTYTYSLTIQGAPVKGEGEDVQVDSAPALAGAMPTLAGAVTGVAQNPVSAATAGYAQMLRDIRSWGYWSLGLGALHLVLSGLFSASWGVLLVLVGLASFLFHDAAMFVVYGTTLAWAAVSNLLGGSPTWIAFAILQAFLVVRVFSGFSRYRRVEREFRALAPVEAAKDRAAGRAARVFTWLGCVLGILALGGIQAWLVAIVLMGESAPFQLLDLLADGLLNLAVLGLAVSLASLLAGYRYRLLAVLGVATSAIVIAGGLALTLL